jgi:chorismate synthase
MSYNSIYIKGAKVHNLKNIELNIPHNSLVVVTGLSGSGKSTLAFDTIFAEGQRRYVESLSSYARQFLGRMTKPDVDIITGIRGSETLGNNIAMVIKNGAHSEFVSEMGVFDCDLQSSKITALRPGHADLGGISRGNFTDARSVMEGASARNTCIDAALGAVAISMLSMLPVLCCQSMMPGLDFDP